MKSTLIYLLRHGATALNQERPYRLQGRRSDPPLDEAGIHQARRAADALAELALTACYTSPLARARETAAIVAAPHELTPVAVNELIEAEIGRWEARTWEEVQEREPELYQRFLASPGTTPYPEGESFQNVQDRAWPAMLALARAHAGERILVVGHNILNRAYLAKVIGLPIDAARAIRQVNCGINVIDYEGDQPVLITLNSALHLNGLV